MKTYRQYLNEAKAKDVLQKYPHLAHLDQQHVSSYGMHLGKITKPDDDPIKIKTAIEKFHNDKNSLPAEKRDISQYKSIDDIHNAVAPIQKKRELKQDTETLHNDPEKNIQIKHIKTRESCETGYGGGKTNWCVAAGGKGNRFDAYGKKGNKMFTVHHGDKVYGMHEHELGTIRDSKNNEVDTHDMHPDVLKAMAKVPEMSRINVMSRNPHTSEEHITKALNDKDLEIRHDAISHPNVTPEHITKALSDRSFHVRLAAIAHPKATAEHITKALNDKEPTIREIAISHDKVTPEHITKALNDKHEYIRTIAARRQKNIKEHVTFERFLRSLNK